MYHTEIALSENKSTWLYKSNYFLLLFFGFRTFSTLAKQPCRKYHNWPEEPLSPFHGRIYAEEGKWVKINKMVQFLQNWERKQIAWIYRKRQIYFFLNWNPIWHTKQTKGPCSLSHCISCHGQGRPEHRCSPDCANWDQSPHPWCLPAHCRSSTWMPWLRLFADFDCFCFDSCFSVDFNLQGS